ncbi:hypothetical protein BV210_12145 [Halorientalis sp. IM1011]|uniref:hypothetical protein n=1 Tax=Halorientalis sp. IM1011 TaxID=1932360 RepID=UPI00097CC78A|nr:hypothetical protein [Halorientalis sp. IM1011]AQL43395.1 hypothetical protein BV210_12145 [Halorientalis sp. IM1011]
MVTLSDDAVAEIKHEGESMTTIDLLTLIERHHPETDGLDRETLEAYADRLAEERDYAFDAESFLSAVDDALTDTNEFDDGLLYRLGDDRISVYPQSWHDELGDSADAEAYVGFLQDVDGFPAASADTDLGVPERELESVLSVVGRISRDEARTVIERQREDGRLVEDADQHRNAGVYRSEDAEGLRDVTDHSEPLHDENAER